ncbi:MAG: hypothetical protein ACREDO_03975 [Methyloceanibacter sp.]
MFSAARVVGHALREIHRVDGGYLQQHDVDFTASFILAGQVKGGQLRLFMVYDGGNFIEAMGDTSYFQIGEVKYGKPILDRYHQSENQFERRREKRTDLVRLDYAPERVGGPTDRRHDLPARLVKAGLHDQARRRRSLSASHSRRVERRNPQGVSRHHPRPGLALLKIPNDRRS